MFLDLKSEYVSLCFSKVGHLAPKDPQIPPKSFKDKSKTQVSVGLGCIMKKQTWLRMNASFAVCLPVQ